MVSLDDAVIARLNQRDHHFEILADSYNAIDLINRKEIESLSGLFIDVNFQRLEKKNVIPLNTL